jgi:hypothetical protein
LPATGLTMVSTSWSSATRNQRRRSTDVSTAYRNARHASSAFGRPIENSGVASPPPTRFSEGFAKAGISSKTASAWPTPSRPSAYGHGERYPVALNADGSAACTKNKGLKFGSPIGTRSYDPSINSRSTSLGNRCRARVGGLCLMDYLGAQQQAVFP